MKMTLTNFTVGYGSPLTTMPPLSATLNSHDRLALLGPSGIGKSTLAKTLGGFLVPVGGRVTLSTDDRGSAVDFSLNADESDGSIAFLNKAGAQLIQVVHQHPEHALDPYVRIQTYLWRLALTSHPSMSLLPPMRCRRAALKDRGLRVILTS